MTAPERSGASKRLAPRRARRTFLIWQVENFLTAAESEHIIRRAEPHMQVRRDRG